MKMSISVDRGRLCHIKLTSGNILFAIHSQVNPHRVFNNIFLLFESLHYRWTAYKYTKLRFHKRDVVWRFEREHNYRLKARSHQEQIILTKTTSPIDYPSSILLYLWCWLLYFIKFRAIYKNLFYTVNMVGIGLNCDQAKARRLDE